MGVIVCERHGRTGIALVCEHLEADVVARRPLSAHTKFVVTLGGDALVPHELCDACRDRARLPPQGGVVEDDAWEAVGAPSIPVCALCRDEVASVAK